MKRIEAESKRKMIAMKKMAKANLKKVMKDYWSTRK